MRRTTLTVTTLTVAAALAAATAGATEGPANAPIPLAARGDMPWVFVDRQGITHVTWDTPVGNDSHTYYRRALPGSRTFSDPVELPVAAGSDFVGSHITQDPAPSNRLVMVADRCCTTGVPETWALTSTNGGATWSTATPIADSGPSGNARGGRLNLVTNGPAGIWVVDGNPGFRLITVPTVLTPLAGTAAETPITTDPYDGQVVVDPTGQPVFAFGTINSGAPHTSSIRIGQTGADQLAFTSSVVPSIHLASGPLGTIAVGLGGSAADTFIAVRRIQDGGLTPEERVSVLGDDHPAVPYASADTSGRFHLVWRAGSGALMYRRSDTGTTWNPPQTLVDPGPARPYGPVVSAGPDGNGWAVYTDAIEDGQVLAVPVGEDFSVPDTTGIPNARITQRGTGTFVTPGNPSLSDLRRRKCVDVRVQTTQPADIRVAIHSGRRSVRIFGATIVRFPTPGKQIVCVRVPLKARTFDVRQPFRFAFAVRSTAPGIASTQPAVLATTGFTRFK